MNEKISIVQMENELCSKLEQYEQLAVTAYTEAMNRSQVKHMINEEEKQRAESKARIIRLAAMAGSALIAVFFYKAFFGW